VKNADMPAMPISEEETDRFNEGVLIYTGLTKREHFAAMAMQGILAGNVWNEVTMDSPESEAVRLADALLAELEKTQ
jgi:hypothetical protein